MCRRSNFSFHVEDSIVGPFGMEGIGATCLELDGTSKHITCGKSDERAADARQKMMSGGSFLGSAGVALALAFGGILKDAVQILCSITSVGNRDL